MRITTVRVVSQAFFFLLFAGLVALTTHAQLSAHPGLARTVSKFLEIDPLVALSTALATHTLYQGLLWSLVLIIPTLLIGRFFCNWVCPFGTLHHFTGWLFRRRKRADRMAANRYRWFFVAKYYILIGMLVAAACGSLQIGLLDPIVFLHRGITVAVLPALGLPGGSGALPIPWPAGEPRVYQAAWLIGGLLALFVGLNLVIPRFFCRTLCPLGALLGVLSRFSLWRIHRDEDSCTGCNHCLQACEGASDPHAQLRKSECFVCFNCLDDCPHGSLRFAFLPDKQGEITSPTWDRRSVVFAGLGGLAAFAWTRTTGRTTRNFSAKVIRPPGSVEELEFLERCLKCDQCLRVCPTNVLQPAALEAGIQGVWTPVMNFRAGHCQYRCTACGHVCPTGAIQRLSVPEKLGVGEFAEQGPIRLGTAHFDVGRCLPWSKSVPCLVCEEVCPVSPKAIWTEPTQIMVRDGKKVVTVVGTNSLTLANLPQAGRAGGVAPPPAAFEPGQFRGDDTRRYYLRLIEPGLPMTSYAIRDNGVDTIKIAGTFTTPPRVGGLVALFVELGLPRIDTNRCIGCGICEKECPVVGDRRAVYVTAEGETRSRAYDERDRNRSLRLT